MKLFISISTAPEREYMTGERPEDYKGDGYIWKNEDDKKRTPEKLEFSLNDFNFSGTLSPLMFIITNFLQEYMVSQEVNKSIQKAKKESEKIMNTIIEVKK